MLYEPTNITPSTLNGTGAIDVYDLVNISWQVNGNSKLTGFKIDFYTNDAASTFERTVTETDLSFYGRNQLGDIQQFSYTPNVTWDNWGLVNGKQYKFKITQYYDGGSIEQRSFATFATYDTPTAIVTIDGYTPGPGEVYSKSSISATAQYTSETPTNTIQSVRWRLIKKIDDNEEREINDTGYIETGDLKYKYDEITENGYYVLYCYIKSISGQMARGGRYSGSIPSVGISVTLPTPQTDINFKSTRLCDETCNLLSWDNPGLLIPGEGYKFSIENNKAIIDDMGGINWTISQVPGNLPSRINIEPSWTAIWKGQKPTQDVTIATISNYKLTYTAGDRTYRYDRGYDTTITLGTESYTSVAIVIQPDKMTVFRYNENGTVQSDVKITQSQGTLNEVGLYGPQTCDYIAIVKGDGSNIIQKLNSSSFMPKWDSAEYELYLYSCFADELNAGNALVSSGYRIIKSENNSLININVANITADIIQLKDYGNKSNADYKYTIYGYDSAYKIVAFENATISSCQFQCYSLLATTYSETDGCYHVYKEYQFGCNLQNMSVSNNANSSYVQNFTPYPTRMYSNANYASGTLQALIGFVDRQSYRYFDSVKLVDELNALSTADYVLFLKDMKGHIRMVAPNGAVTQTVNIKSPQLEVTISFPWVEIGNANKVSIIQLPTDEGWNNDAQLLDVKIGIDYNTGELVVTYPYPYYGTRFAYSKNTGVLSTTTPADVTPRKVTLDTAPKSDTSGAVLADKTNNGGNG